MSLRATIRVYGEVQGVAFRSTIKRIANKMGIRGTIENRDDGSVWLVCEAQKQDIELFIVKIKNIDTLTHITGMQVEYSVATGEYKTFHIVLGDMQEELLSAVITGTTFLERVSKGIESIKAQNETIMGQNKTIIGQNDTLIEYAKDNSKQNRTIMGQNDTLIEYAKDNSKQSGNMLMS